ncbi:MAG: hemolysin family protein [Porphyromonas sp.]|nr:hemolysin family protein [Porphyromonas sp.]
MIYLYIFICVLFSAFFSGMEIAFVSSDRLRIELDKSSDNRIGKLQTLFFNNPGQFITTMLVGNNIALVVFGLLMAQLLEPSLSLIISNPFLVVLAQTLISTAIILITAEFIPKAIAKINPNWSLRFFSFPLTIIYIVLYPIAKLSALLSNLLLFLFGIRKDMSAEVKLGKIDLDNYIEVNQGEVSQGKEPAIGGVKILQNAIDFSDVHLRDCLVPRNEIVAVEESATREELLELFISSGFSKIIVYRDTIDDIIGYIHSVEMFAEQRGDWRKSIRSTLYAPESVLAQKMMKKLMQEKMSIAVVVDELGGTAGIVTLEDLLEEIFGDIEDEHDTLSVVMKQTGDNEYIFSGRAEIDDINDKFSLNLPTSPDYLTIAGLILDLHQSLPNRGDIILLEPHFKFNIIRATKNKIMLVRLTIANSPE